QSYEYSPSGWTPGDPPPTQTDEYLAEEIGIRVLGNVQLSAAQRLARFTADVPDKHVTAAEAAAAVPFPDSFVFTLGFRFFPLPNQANTAAERARHETMLSATASNFSSWTGWNLVSRTPRAD